MTTATAGRVFIALVLLLAGGLLVSCGGGGEEAPEAVTPGGPGEGQPPPAVGDGATMVVDAVGGGAVDATRTVTDASPFDVDVNVSKAVSGYQGYQYMVQWDPAVLAHEGQEDLKPAEMELCAAAIVRENTVYGGCARVSGNTNYIGPTNRLTFRCVADGTSPLHLMTSSEDRHFRTTALGYAGVTVETTLTDASVTCQGLSQVPVPAPATPSQEGFAPD